MVGYWLGPFCVLKEPRARGRNAHRWMIVSRTGQPVQIRIPYRKDADEACRVLNLGVKVVPR